MTTFTKANVAGVAGPLIIVATWLLTLIPRWAEIPDEPRGALVFLVSVVIGWTLVYLAPANQQVRDDPRP